MISTLLLKLCVTFLLGLIAGMLLDIGNDVTPMWIALPAVFCFFCAVICGIGGVGLLIWGL